MSIQVRKRKLIRCRNCGFTATLPEDEPVVACPNCGNADLDVEYFEQ